MQETTPKPSRPIFVVGYMHSGTTLVRELLGGHPEVFATKAETAFFVHLDQIRRRFSLTSPEDLEVFSRFCRYLVEQGFPIGAEGEPWRACDPLDLGYQSHSRTHGEIFARVLWGLTSRAGKRRWLEKTPTHIFHVDSILRSVKSPYFVEVVRDPRDVLASKKTRRQAVWTDRHPARLRYRRHLEKAFDPLWDGLSWQAAVRAGEEAQHVLTDSWFRVRYEDLVHDPQTVVERVCEAVDLDAGSISFDVSRGIPADITMRDRDERGVATTSVGRFGSVLEPNEVATCQFVGGRAMRRLGYMHEQTDVGGLSVLWGVLSRSGPEFALRLCRRFRLGGVRYGLDVLSGYLRRAGAIFRRRLL